jgi:ppGpp synthetase/RelA/SpoT-type nucleotidyltranferase
MIVVKSLQEKYLEDIPHFKILGRRVNDTLLPYCEKYHFAYTSRYKEMESVAEKVESGRYSSWNAIDDLFAATIIIPNLKQEDAVIDFLRDVFEFDAIKRRGSTLKAPDVFRFDATRVVAHLKAFGAEKQHLHELKFEIQVRSAFEHAWSAATHSLTYKSDEINWKAMRLAAQIKAACKMQIMEFIATCLRTNAIPEEVRPKDLTRFAENMFGLLQHSAGWPRNNNHMPGFIETICRVLSNEISLYRSITFPRSISLLQFCLGTLITTGDLQLPLQGYVPIVTEELETLFPAIKTVQTRFEI